VTTTPLMITVDSTSPVPPFEQIRVAIESLILGGTLETGATLPPVRQLAADLRVAPGTVQRAYQELHTAGLVLSRSRRGVIVTYRFPRRLDPDRLADAAHEYVALGRRSGATTDQLRRAFEQALRSGPPGPVDRPGRVAN
jgi:GntR family transcriptional regulator